MSAQPLFIDTNTQVTHIDDGRRGVVVRMETKNIARVLWSNADESEIIPRIKLQSADVIPFPDPMQSASENTQPTTEEVVTDSVPPAQPETLLDWALDAQRRGWFVFPCDAGGKEPAGEVVPKGVLDASNDPNVIRAWWAKNPNYNPAIALGPSNLVGYDFDSIAPYADLPATLTIRSGRNLKEGESGGIHMYFRGSCTTRSLFAEPIEPITEREEVTKKGDTIKVHYDALGRKVGKRGVTVGEIRSRGSYLIAPGATHKSGRPYTIVNDVPLADSPEQNAPEVHTDGPAIGSDEQNTIATFVEEAFDESGVDYKNRVAYNGGFKWLVDCPWEYEHSGGKGISQGGSSSAVFMTSQGKLGYQCQHAHCEGREWKELREWMTEKVGHKLPFGKPGIETVMIDSVYPARPVGKPTVKEPQSPAKVELPAGSSTDAAIAAAAQTSANVIAVQNYDGKKEDLIPPFDPSIMKGSIYGEFVELATRGTNLVPQFVFSIARNIIGTKMSGNMKFETVGADPRTNTVSIGETGSGKGEAWRRSLTILRAKAPDETEDVSAIKIACGIKIIDSFDSSAGLKDAFFEPPEQAPILCYVDEVTSLGNKAKDSKNPDILDVFIELADSTSISRVTAKRPGSGGGVKTKSNARLSSVICAQDGDTITKAFAGRAKLGLFDRLTPEFATPVPDPGDLPEVDIDGAIALHAKFALIDYTGTMTMTSDAKEMINVYWSNLLPEIRQKARWKKNLALDSYLTAFGRGSMVAELADVEIAIKIFMRQVIIRYACFNIDASDRIGHYLHKIKSITDNMQKRLDAGVPPAKVALSCRDYERLTNAHRDNEEHIFDRAWKVHSSRWLKPVTVQKDNGQKYEKYLPVPEDSDPTGD